MSQVEWANSEQQEKSITKCLVRLIVAIPVCLAIYLLLAAQAQAQIGGSRLPKTLYYNSAVFRQYYQGDYLDAAKNFKRGANGAYKVGNRRHLDSVCYWTMLGECNYHMGNYAEAVTFYEQALALYLSYQNENWQVRLQIPATIQAKNNAFNQTGINWGVRKRTAGFSKPPGSFSMLFGRLDAARAFQEGGVFDKAQLFNVDVIEIMRCTALCIHRRRAIKGPITKLDPFTSQLVTGLSTPDAGNGSIMGSLNGVLLGLAYASMEDWSRATSKLKSSLLINNMEHPLTPVALMEMAQIGFANQKYPVATELAMEASYVAAVYDQYDMVEEALGLGTTIHLMTSKSPFPPLENAIQFAGRKRARMMQASLIVKLAECVAENGDAALATKVLNESKRAITKRSALSKAVVSARAKYVTAIIDFLKGDVKRGRSNLAAALQHFQTGSLWLYRLSLAEQLDGAGNISQRQADLMYGMLLRDPSEFDWKTDPLESIAFLASPHVATMERWFEIVVDRKDNRRALEIADMVRRHRFFSSLPMGGRLMAFRWVMHAPDEALTQAALAQRQNFINRNGGYRQLINEANQIRTALMLLPVKPDPQSAEDREQTKLMKDLAKVSETQEAILASFALRREPAEMVFPPQLPISAFLGRIRADQLGLVSLATNNGYHIFLMNADALQYLGAFSDRDVNRGVGDLLKKMGLMNVALDVKEIQDEEWKESAREIKDLMFAGATDDKWKQFKELVVVPDGVLWYLPFEALPIGEGADEKYLSDIVDIRYSPTLFLAFQQQRPIRDVKRTAVVAGRMHQRGEGDLASKEFDELKKAMPDTALFDSPINIPTSYLSTVIDQLMVWSEIKDPKSLPLSMQPMQLDKARVGATLESWMTLPWNGPEHIILPGYHSDGGAGMRGQARGRDLFMTTMGLMASGTRTALISRWATGGKTTLSLTRMYASEIGKNGVAKAIQSSRQKTRALDVEYANEPRIRSKKVDPVVKAEHPFFWSSHMLMSIPDTRPPGARPGDNDAADVDAADNGQDEDDKVVDPDAQNDGKQKAADDDGDQ